ncbi:MAG: MBL fold metallo-hydrolase [Chlamydiia bacterium]|nr:MBL fold metallo-hydrolase [Chlamydiia bacterium]
MNKNKTTFLFLGTGASTGIPLIGCECPICLSEDPYNKRFRPSALLKVGDKQILIDIGPDFRYQMLENRITHLDGVMLTHTHYDHIAGLDELRTFYLLHRRVIPLIVSKSSLEDLKTRYHYLFREKSCGQSLAAQLDIKTLESERGISLFLDIPFQYMTYEQGGMKVTGYRFGNFAYTTDIRDYPETLFEDLSGVNTLVMSALRHTTSPMHLNLEEAIAFSRAVGAKKTYFTHMSHELDHQTTNAALPEGFELAYDGLELCLN